MKFNRNINIVITARIRSMTGGYVFTGVCLFTFLGVGDTPSQVWMGGGPIPGGGTPSQVWMRGYPIPGLDGGTHPRCWVPHLRSGRGHTPIQDLDRGVPRVSPCQDWGVPPSKTGWGTRPPSPSGDGSAKRALATRLTVCLLRSRRRTFFFAFLMSQTCC